MAQHEVQLKGLRGAKFAGAVAERGSSRRSPGSGLVTSSLQAAIPKPFLVLYSQLHCQQLLKSQTEKPLHKGREKQQKEGCQALNGALGQQSFWQ